MSLSPDAYRPEVVAAYLRAHACKYADEQDQLIEEANRLSGEGVTARELTAIVNGDRMIMLRGRMND